jgi:hypothetical protein
MNHQLAIKNNNVATNDPCAICGQRTDPTIGPELFLEESMALVCWMCGLQRAPELVLMLEHYHNQSPAWDTAQRQQLASRFSTPSELTIKEAFAE